MGNFNCVVSGVWGLQAGVVCAELECCSTAVQQVLQNEHQPVLLLARVRNACALTCWLLSAQLLTVGCWCWLLSSAAMQ